MLKEYVSPDIDLFYHLTFHICTSDSEYELLCVGLYVEKAIMNMGILENALFLKWVYRGWLGFDMISAVVAADLLRSISWRCH